MIDSKYKNIISLPHHESKNHKKMSLLDRASQFAPFAALTGYEESIEEKGIYYERKKELNNEEKELISNKINYLLNHLKDRNEIKIIYFVLEKDDSLGHYNLEKGVLKKYDQQKKVIILENRKQIKISDIYELKIDCLDDFYND